MTRLAAVLALLWALALPSLSQATLWDVLIEAYADFCWLFPDRCDGGGDGGWEW